MFKSFICLIPHTIFQLCVPYLLATVYKFPLKIVSIVKSTHMINSYCPLSSIYSSLVLFCLRFEMSRHIFLLNESKCGHKDTIFCFENIYLKHVVCNWPPGKERFLSVQILSPRENQVKTTNKDLGELYNIPFFFHLQFFARLL